MSDPADLTMVDEDHIRWCHRVPLYAPRGTVREWDHGRLVDLLVYEDVSHPDLDDRFAVGIGRDVWGDALTETAAYESAAVDPDEDDDGDDRGRWD